nr:MAG TPA: hypothetical protein [Caudoviricetes sp.]
MLVPLLLHSSFRRKCKSIKIIRQKSDFLLDNAT